MSEKIYTIEELKSMLQEILKNFAVKKAILFGSYAKNQPTVDSDIDLLVNFKQPIDMFDFMDLQEHLSKIFRKKIDLGTINSLKKFVKNSILKEAIAL